MTMDWQKLLDTRLLEDPTREEKENRPNYAQDYDRIVFSQPFRRLANKTQVHPLYAKDHIHHRLIHSVETSSVGRSLGIEVGQWLEEEGNIEPGKKHTVSGVVQAACAAHDIGNPPFGHSGEEAIGSWFEEKFRQKSHDLFMDVNKEDRKEFEAFEGNAQGFRVISRLEMYRNEGGMRLSYATLGAFTKYPALARAHAFAKEEATKSDEPLYKGLSKFGLFRSEAALFNDVAKALGLIAHSVNGTECWKRHPLVFLVEAADDICYNIMDLEDAYDAGDVSKAEVKKLLGALFPKPNRDFSSSLPVEEIGYYRARAIGAAIAACVEAFKENYVAIMDGRFSASLISESSVAEAFAAIERVAKSQIFSAPRKTKLEVAGRNIIHDVLSGLEPLYAELSELGWDDSRLSSYHRQLAAAVQLDLRGVADAYSALHNMCDFVSGMTDRYAASVQGMLRGRLD